MTALITFHNQHEFDIAYAKLQHVSFSGKTLSAVHPQSEGLLFVGNLGTLTPHISQHALCTERAVLYLSFSGALPPPHEYKNTLNMYPSRLFSTEES